MCTAWHSVWAGTPGVPLARCGCSILNDRGAEAEETSPGVLHHAIPRCRVGLIAPSFCAPYEPPWHLASCIHYVVSQCYFRLWCSCITGGGWYTAARLLASKYDSWGEFLTPLFWTLHARSGVMYCVMQCINSLQWLERVSLSCTVIMYCERDKRQISIFSCCYQSCTSLFVLIFGLGR